MYWLLVLIILSGEVWAQPWQWEVYQEDYYNPTGFPNAAVRIGDFNGNGGGEMVAMVDGQLRMFRKDGGVFHWSEDSCAVPPGSLGSDAYDVDGDSADEIIAIGDTFHCWKSVWSNPWTWEARDDLVAGFQRPSFAWYGVFGDFDQDGLVNGFYMAGDWEATFWLTERQQDGTWTTDTTFNNFEGEWGISSGIYAGDFDHDGDRDIAVAPQLGGDVPPYGGFGESTPQGIVWHIGSNWGWLMSFPGPTGGDIDGDGQWEGLYRPLYYSGYSLVETAPGGDFIETAESHYLGQPGGIAFGNFRTGGHTVVGAVHNWTWGAPWPTNHSFNCLMRSDSGWQGFYSGFASSWGPYGGYTCTLGSRADLDGDGLEDIFTALADDGESWGIWRNHGTADQDSFSILYQHNPYFTHRFLTNLDTSFGYPLIGDITGDGRAELAVIGIPSDSLRHAYFFEMIGAITDTTFVLHPEWSVGIPLGFQRIRFADIDGDRLAELMGQVTGDNWRTFFRRNGTWEEYEGVLPEITDGNIAFADADNDGDLDLFTPTSLYYSLSPSGVRPESERTAVRRYELNAYPNPFNGEMTITYDVPRRGFVELAVYNVLGEKVEELVSGTVDAGQHAAVWRPQVSSGIYFAKLEAGASKVMRKVVYLR